MKQFAIALLLLSSLSITAQKNKNQETAPAEQKSTSPDLFSLQMSIYKNAVKYYDLQAASVALYNAIALKPERKDLYDSLTYLYFAGERYGQVYLMGEDILKRDENRNDIREMLAVAKQALNMPKEALADYEKIFNATKELQYLYQVATLQYQLKRFGECIASLEQIIANPESEKKQIAIKNQDGGGQNVPMKAAAFNVKGICALEVNQDDAAKENFNEALKLFPDFVLAKNNLTLVEQRKAAAAKTSTTPNTTGTPAPKK